MSGTVGEKNNGAHHDASVVWRILRTPLSELIFGHSPKRVKLSLLDAAALPEPLPQTIRTVTRRTRLWKRERLEVMRELISHFQDGLDSGATAEDLVRSFGDLKQAAKLIRRAKKRNRPIWWRAGKRTIQGALLLPVILIVLYIPIAIRFFAGSPTISHDYLADLNKVAAAVPENERAWPLYREALIGLPHLHTIVDRPDADQPHPGAVKPGDPDWPAFERFVVEHSDRVPIIRRAAAIPGLGYVASTGISAEDSELWPFPKPEENRSDGSLISVLLPYLSELRKIGTFLVLDIRRAAAAGDASTVVENFNALLGIVRHTRENQTLIADMVGLAIFQMTLDRVGEFLAEQPQLFSDEQLKQLAHRIAAFSDDELRVRLDSERLWFYDIVQRSYTDDGNGNGRMTPAGLRWMDLLGGSVAPAGWSENSSLMAAAPAYSVIVLDRRELLKEYERLLAEAERNGNLPLWERKSSSVDEQLDRWMNSPIDRMRYLPIALLMPALDKATMVQHYARFNRDTILTVIALELHQRRQGEWPKSLEELVPSLLPVVPRDLFDGQPMKYTIINGRPVLYSIGNDRDDDGGKPPMWFSEGGTDNSAVKRWTPVPLNTGIHHPKGQDVFDGDWILWPTSDPSQQ